jgi:hypothetical protein
MSRHLRVGMRVAGTVESSVTNRIYGSNAKWFANPEQSDLVFVPSFW